MYSNFLERGGLYIIKFELENQIMKLKHFGFCKKNFNLYCQKNNIQIHRWIHRIELQMIKDVPIIYTIVIHRSFKT